MEAGLYIRHKDGIILKSTWIPDYLTNTIYREYKILKLFSDEIYQDNH